MLAPKTIEDVKAYHDLVGLISEYVPLKKRGRNFLGLCPFHGEKTPSFTVSPDKKIWHCFGCHESGNLISFIMKIENLGFTEAVTSIAKKVGIEIIEEKEKKFVSKEDKDYYELGNLLYAAREFFKEQLLKNKPSYDYLIKRGLSEKSIKEFHLGYAPNTAELHSYLVAKGFNQEYLLKSGLYYLNDNQEIRPRFWQRIIFPIIDEKGRTIAFGGRIFNNEINTGKYINTEETLLFNKRQVLFGLNQAKNVISENNALILMEGYLDVIFAHQFGFKNTVGSMGTALTEEQIKKIKRLTNTIYLAFDSDEAGKKAEARNSELLNAAELKVFLINYPAKDPADYLLEYGGESFQKLIKEADSLILAQYKKIKKEIGLDSIEKKLRILEKIKPILSKEDSVVKDYYVKILSYDLGVDHEFIKEKLSEHNQVLKKNNYFAYKNKNKYGKAEEIVLYLIAEKIEKSLILENLKEENFVSPIGRSLFNKFKISDLKGSDLLNKLEEKEEKAFLSRILLLGGNKDNYLLDEINDYINTLKNYNKQNKLTDIKNRIRELEQDPTKEEELNLLLNEFNNLIINKSLDKEG
ncbi:MAG: DNA primase [Candidatus Margulisiibacteriota bacterium]|jgi:DNA primase